MTNEATNPPRLVGRILIAIAEGREWRDRDTTVEAMMAGGWAQYRGYDDCESGQCTRWLLTPRGSVWSQHN